jgi:sugar (pentulose or hexulose) kinase
MSFIGIDIGSTTIKAGVLDLDRGTVANVRSQPFPGPINGLPAAWFEVDAEAVVSATGQLIDEMFALTDDCAGIVVSCQMGGVVMTDASGSAVTNYLSWRDQRTLEVQPQNGRSYLDEMRQQMTAEDWNRIGRELKPGTAAALLYWLAANSAIPSDATHAMGLGEYVVSRLCQAQPRAEPTLALGLLNLESLDWHTEWFARLGFGQLNWPQLSTAVESAGDVSCGASKIPCYPAIGDQQAALLGAELAEEELSINISTGSQVAMLTSVFTPGDYQTRPYFDGQLLNTITHLPAGRSLSALVDLLRELPRAEGHALRDPWGAIAQAVGRAPTSELDVNLAFFATPLGDRGHISNIRLEDLTVGSLFRAAFEHMADNYLRFARLLSPDERWSRLVLSGGLPQKLPALRQMIADRFNRPIRMVDTPEETLQGLLQLARRIAQSS